MYLSGCWNKRFYGNNVVLCNSHTPGTDWLGEPDTGQLGGSVVSTVASQQCCSQVLDVRVESSLKSSVSESKSSHESPKINMLESESSPKSSLLESKSSLESSNHPWLCILFTLLIGKFRLRKNLVFYSVLHPVRNSDGASRFEK